MNEIFFSFLSFNLILIFFGSIFIPPHVIQGYSCSKRVILLRLYGRHPIWCVHLNMRAHSLNLCMYIPGMIQDTRGNSFICRLLGHVRSIFMIFVESVWLDVSFYICILCVFSVPVSLLRFQPPRHRFLQKNWCNFSLY